MSTFFVGCVSPKIIIDVYFWPYGRFVRFGWMLADEGRTDNNFYFQCCIDLIFSKRCNRTAAVFDNLYCNESNTIESINESSCESIDQATASDRERWNTSFT